MIYVVIDSIRLSLSGLFAFMVSVSLFLKDLYWLERFFRVFQLYCSWFSIVFEFVFLFFCCGFLVFFVTLSSSSGLLPCVPAEVAALPPIIGLEYILKC